MQDLEPDMEDLLRRASEAYPLKQGEDKWSDIASRMDERHSNVVVQKKQWYQKASNALLLLLCLLSPAILDVNFLKQANVSAVFKSKKYPATSSSTDNGVRVEHQTFSVSEAKNNTKSLVKRHVPGTRLQVVNGDHFKQTKTFLGKQATQTFNEIKNIACVNIANVASLNNFKEQTNFANNNITTNSLPGEILSIPVYRNKNLVNKNDLPSKQSPIIKQSDSLAGKNKPPKVNDKTSTGFYYGALVGMGLNAVKEQSFNKAGFNAGGVAGYRFNRNFSLETGLLFAKKYYWTDGKYFSTAQMGSTMPAETEITEVHGSSRIIEVPLHLLYDFLIKPNKRLYIVAGLSSYSIIEENNDYATLHNGIKGIMHGSYKNDRRYFAATADLGIGYQRDFVKSHLRFEPYIQLPVQGVGIGSLHVKTAGLKIAFTRSVH